MESTQWGQVILSQVWVVPHLIVSIAGLVASLKYLSRYPMPALLALCGCMLLLGNTLGGAAFQVWIITSGPERISDTSTQWVIGIVTAFRMLAGAGGVALLIVAVFAGRAPLSAKAES